MVLIKMWFLSVHIPTKEQIDDAHDMSYELIHVKTPEIGKDEDVEKLVRNLLETIPWNPQDCFVIMGEPRWIAVFVSLYQQSFDDSDGGIDVYLPSNQPSQMMKRGGYIVSNTGKVQYPARFMNLMTTFTERNVVEVIENGQKVKKSVFKHGGFVPLL